MATRRGGTGKDSLIGTKDADILLGLAGDDTLQGDGGNDRLDGGIGDDSLFGGVGNDILLGGAGNDSLLGGPGRDSLRGGAGNDRLVIDAATEVDKALADAGIDTVVSAISYRLGDYQENLVLTGNGALHGTGNALANVIVGNSGANVLAGGPGVDRLKGGGGDDMLVYDVNDALIDGGTGNDTLRIDRVAPLLNATRFAHTSAIEVLDLRGAFANHLSVDEALVKRLSDTDVLRIRAGGNDDLTASGTWLVLADTVIDHVRYAQYTLNGATLQVETSVPRLIGGAMSLASLNGSDGFRLDGVATSGNIGNSISAAGDINGDGFDDFIAGARGADANGSSAGASYVVFGHGTSLSATFALASLDGSNGFRLDGVAAHDNSGSSVSAAGDVNGDGFDDLIVGAPRANTNGSYSGASYVVFGHGAPFTASLALASLDGDIGFRLDGVAADDYSGFPVSAAGDVNGDGFDDLIVGAPHADPNGSLSGASYVVFGHGASFDATFALASLDGSNGFRLEGEGPGDGSGFSVNAAGDVNGDGFDDLIVGAPRANTNVSYSGASYVVFGHGTPFNASLELANLDGTDGFRLDGVAVFDGSGEVVGGAGDVNGDGFDDLIVGAYQADPNGFDSGASYVVFGHGTPFAATLALASLDGSNGFRLDGVAASDHSGWAVSAAGDVNGDGFDDLVVGAFGADPNGAYSGASYVVFGRSAPFTASLALASLDGSIGFRLDGVAANDLSGNSVSAAGDVNGDGFDDLIVGAPVAEPNGLASGASYVVFGRDYTGLVSLQGDDGNNALSGTSADEILIGARGDDMLDGGTGSDVLIGGAGNDTLVWDAFDRHVSGGTGNDVLRVDDNNLMLDFAALSQNKLTGIDVIDLSGNGDHHVEFTLQDLIDLSDHASLQIAGDAGDTVEITTSGWTQGANQTLGAQTYASYTHGGASLLIDLDIGLTIG